MEHFNFLSYEYYKTFYSYQGYLKKLALNLSLTFISGGLFTYSFIDLIFFASHSKPHIYYPMGLMLICELVFLSSFARLTYKKKELIIIKLKQEINEDNIPAFKKRWLLETFEVKATGYADIAKNVLDANCILNQNKRFLDFNRYNFYKLIYNDSAKVRVLSLSLALISILSIIILKDPKAHEYLYHEMMNTSNINILTFVTLGSIYLSLTLICIKYIALSIVYSLEVIFTYVTGQKEANEYMSKFLIYDLIKYNRIAIHNKKS